jgi:hypothetical protein
MEHQSTYTLLQWQSLLLAICIGPIAWNTLYLVSRGLAEKQKVSIYAKNA